jgi:hypothetical protein
MPIKYAEITIIFNEEKETMKNYFNRILFGNENKTNDNDNIIILFDDESIYDTKNIENIKSHKKINMGPKYYNRSVPMHFEIEPLKLYFFSKEPTIINNIPKLNFKPIFSNSHKFLTSKREPSEFNIVYYQLLKKDNDSLAIVKIKSSETKPRFLVAYDDTYFEKEDIIYFISYIFCEK